MDLVRASDCKVCILDAALLYGLGFSLQRLLQLAETRAKNISCFTRADMASTLLLIAQSLQPVRVSLGPTCPRILHEGSSEEQTRHSGVPLHILASESAVALMRKGILKGPNIGPQLLPDDEQHAFYGLEVPIPQTSAQYLSDTSQALASRQPAKQSSERISPAAA